MNSHKPSAAAEANNNVKNGFFASINNFLTTPLTYNKISEEDQKAQAQRVLNRVVPSVEPVINNKIRPVGEVPLFIAGESLKMALIFGVVALVIFKKI